MFSKVAAMLRWIAHSIRQTGRKRIVVDESGTSWLIDPANALDQHVLSGKSECLDLLDHLKPKAGVAFDVGANAGYWAIPLAHLGFQVYAFEPDPFVFEKLQRNVQINKWSKEQLRIDKVAISDGDGSAEFNVRRSIDGDSNLNLGLSSLVAKSNVSKRITVLTRSIDSICSTENIQNVALIKVDVEGAEHLVITGALETIRAQTPIVIWECLLNSEGNRENSESVFRILSELNYSHSAALADGTFRPISNFRNLLDIGIDVNIASSPTR